MSAENVQKVEISGVNSSMKGLAISDAGAIGPTDIGNMAQHGSNMFHEKKIQIRTCGCKDQMWLAGDGFKFQRSSKNF